APAPVPPATPAPTSTETSDKLKAYTFEQRAEFKGFVNELTAQSDAVVTKLNMGYNSMLVTPARRTAMENLTKAAADFKTQAHALDNVSADTWDSVKSALVNCWQNFAGALTKVRESKN
ncbi:MAG: hypothetical protein PSW75_02520, partial [bacterium]|nr:hypothetical protein [bacterium]